MTQTESSLDLFSEIVMVLEHGQENTLTI